MRRQASSPDCRIASASTPGGALRATYFRCLVVTFFRSWLVFGAVTVAALPGLPALDDPETFPPGPLMPDVDGPYARPSDCEPPEPTDGEPPDRSAAEVVLAVVDSEPPCAPTAPSPWPPHAAVARTTVNNAPRRRGRDFTALRRRG